MAKIFACIYGLRREPVNWNPWFLLLFWATYNFTTFLFLSEEMDSICDSHVTDLVGIYGCCWHLGFFHTNTHNQTDAGCPIVSFHGWALYENFYYYVINIIGEKKSNNQIRPLNFSTHAFSTEISSLSVSKLSVSLFLGVLVRHPETIHVHAG